MNMEDYWKKNYRVGKFGIKYLDEHLNGISKNDLIIIGSRSGCVDKETEFFCQDGWKKISEYKNGDFVLQADDKTLKAELVKPLDYIKGICDKWYVFHSKYGIDMKLSQEHNVFYKTCSNNYKKDTAENIYNRYIKNKKGFEGLIPMSFDYSGEGINLTDGQIKVMLAAIADGTLCYNQCRFHIKKDRKKQELRKIFREALIEWREKESSENGYIDFYIKLPIHTKKFDLSWYKCNKHQLKVICENVLKWDGKIDKKGRMLFFTTDINSANFIQFAFSACGYKATLKKYDRRGRVRNIKGKEYITKSIDYVVSITKRNCCGMADKNKKSIIKIENSLEYKYCFTVPSGILVLRRNGHIFITGNSGKTSIATRIFNVNNQNIKCKLFLLENFDGDLYSNNVFIKYRKYSNQDITQRQWLMNDFKVDYEALDKAEKEVKNSMNEKYIITRQPDYTIQKLKDDMVRAVEQDGCELLIIDHLDYVDKDNPTENDVSHITDLMKTIRRLQDAYNVAVVAISHLRKPDHTKIPVKIPNENEFIGSSNKVKEATVVVMFAPDDDGNLVLNDPYHRRTWCCIRKNRFGGIDGRCANLVYDIKNQCYSDVYEVHSVNYLGTETKLLAGEK